MRVLTVCRTDFIVATKTDTEITNVLNNCTLPACVNHRRILVTALTSFIRLRKFIASGIFSAGLLGEQSPYRRESMKLHIHQ